MKINWNKILMYSCFVYSGISFEFVYIQLTPLLNKSSNLAPPPLPFTYSTIYKTSPSYIYYIIGISILGSIITLLAGISIYRTIKEKEGKKVSKKWVGNITDENDQRIISLIKENGNEITQSHLVRESGMGKVKVHRIVKKLESCNILEKVRYGQTNKIRLRDPVD